MNSNQKFQSIYWKENSQKVIHDAKNISKLTSIVPRFGRLIYIFLHSKWNITNGKNSERSYSLIESAVSVNLIILDNQCILYRFGSPKVNIEQNHLQLTLKCIKQTSWSSKGEIIHGITNDFCEKTSEISKRHRSCNYHLVSHNAITETHNFT